MRTDELTAGLTNNGGTTKLIQHFIYLSEISQVFSMAAGARSMLALVKKNQEIELLQFASGKDMLEFLNTLERNSENYLKKLLNHESLQESKDLSKQISFLNWPRGHKPEQICYKLKVDVLVNESTLAPYEI